MNAAVMTTGPGVIIATATASTNCRSVSQEPPQEPVFSDRSTHKFDSAPGDDRDYRRANSVEHALNPWQATEMNVECRQQKHHYEGRQSKSDTYESGSQRPCAHPPEKHCQLRCERTGRQLGES